MNIIISRNILVVSFLTSSFAVVASASIHPSSLSFHHRPFAASSSSSSSVVTAAFSVPAVSRGTGRPSHHGNLNCDGSSRLCSRSSWRRLRTTTVDGPPALCGRPSFTPRRGVVVRGRGVENTALFATRRRRRRTTPSLDDDGGTDPQPPPKIDVVSSEAEDDEEDQDWISDRELIRRAANTPGGEQLTNRDRFTLKKFRSSGLVSDEDFASEEDAILYSDDDDGQRRRQRITGAPPDGGDAGGGGGRESSVYSEEEEDLIRAMGGKNTVSAPPSSSSRPKTPSYDDGPYFDTDDDRGGVVAGGDDGESSSSGGGRSSQMMREEGYLGDSTLEEISRDYSVPVCYLADVMVTWGCTPPIDPTDLLGDLVTGEQAFSLLEALLTLDTGALNDRYSYDDLATVCDENDVELRDAFEFCVREGYNLPFGVRTCLRVEQEEELLRALGSGDEFEYDYDYGDDSGYYEVD